jgi:heterodisulfide reductase subunit B
MNYGYYPGCSLSGTAKEFDISLKKVLKNLSVELTEIQGWACCGASSAHATSHILSIALPVHSLLKAKEQGLKEVVTPCAACYNRLVNAQHEMKNPVIRERVETVVEHPYSNGLQVLNLIQFFNLLGMDTIKAKVTQKLAHIKAACYYGCLLVRPHEVTGFDDEEQPLGMEKVVEAVGGKTVDWNFKTECCGASHSITHTDIVEHLSKRILDDAIAHGANVIVVACPMCHSNLDMRQLNIKKSFPGHKTIPVLYLSELVGLAMGMSPKELGIDLHFIPSDEILKPAEAVTA